jgi:DNA topoisomerase-3
MATSVSALVEAIAPGTPCNVVQVVNTSKVTDHHAIIPTAEIIDADLSVLPEALTSAKLTAEWEHRLQLIENGELTESAFLEDIATFTRTIVTENKTPKPEFMSLFPDQKRHVAESLGICPRCGSPVREGSKGYFCDSKTCEFKMWKESKFWTAKRKPLTGAIVSALLKDGRVAVKGLHSEKTGKKYDATVILDDTGDGFVNFKLEFEKR